MKRNTLILVGVLVLLAVILVACTGGAVPDEILMPEAHSVPQDDQSEALEAEVVEEPEVKLPREGLEATDPSTVVLASGQPQIVEFFAYW
jgi:hypothetical protein